MLTYEELAAEIRQRPYEELLALRKMIEDSLEDDEIKTAPQNAKLTSNLRGVPVKKVLGMGSIEGVPPPTDEEVKDVIADYLIEKHK